MPELPEVEHFRRLLLPLVSRKDSLRLELTNENTARQFLTADEVSQLNAAQLCVQQVKRRGKQICLYLGKSTSTKPSHFLYVHMGMTGRITTPHQRPQFGHFAKEQEDPTTTASYPPRYTYLTFQAGDAHACFSDPRKFGKVYLATNDHELQQLAPDAWNETFASDALQGQRLGVKALLLDQKRVVSGVGNWVADEILYHTGIHPCQTHLTADQVTSIQTKLPQLLQTAVDCLEQETNYPQDWLFHYRWVKGKTVGVQDGQGRAMQFLTAGGRTTAIVPVLQKWKKSQGKRPPKDAAVVTTSTEKVDLADTADRSSMRKDKRGDEKTIKSKTVVVKKRKLESTTESPRSKGTRRSPRLATITPER